MNLLAKLPLQRRVTAVTVFSCGVALLATSAALFVHHTSASRSSFERTIALVAKIIADHSALPLALRDQVAAHETLSALAATPEILCAYLEATDGELIAEHGQPPSVERTLFPREHGQAYLGGKLLRTQPIHFNGHPIGRLLLLANAAPVRPRLLAVYAGIIALAGAALLAWGFSSHLRRVTSQPIWELAEAAQQVAVDREGSTPNLVAGQDAIATLTEAFNQMLSRIQARENALRQLNLAELQREIEERRRAEKKAQEERDRSRQYFDIAGVLLLVMDLEGRVVLINQRGCAMLSHYSGELIGQNWFDTCVPEQDRPRIRDQFQNMILRGVDSIEFFETTVITRERERRHVQFYNTLIRDSAGKVVGTLSSGEDVTTRRLAEEAHKLDESRLEALVRLNQMDEASVQELADLALAEAVRLTHSQAGFVAFLSEDEATLTLSACSACATQKATGETPLVYAVDQAGLWGEAARKRRAIAANSPSALATLDRLAPASNIVIDRFLAVPVFDGSRIAVVAGVVNKAADYDDSDLRQLTLLMTGMWHTVQRKQSEEARRISDRRFASLFDSMAEGVALHEFVYDERRQPVNYRILNVNAQYEKHVHLNRKQVVGKLAHEAYGTPSPPYLAEYTAVTKTGQPTSFEAHFAPLRRHFCISVAPIEQGRFATIFSDITERKEAEEAARLEEARLTALLKLANMHSTPLEEITDFALEEAVRLTRSQIGYLAFVSEDESTLTMHAWSKTAMQECTMADKPRIYAVASTGLWGEAMRQRRPVITNDYQAPHAAKKGTPPGHVLVRRHMNVPIFEGDRIVAVAGVGNKEAPYEEADARQLTLLMDGMWKQVQRRRTTEALGRSEEKFRALFDNANEAIFIHDLEGRIVEANREAIDRLGYTRDELLQLQVQDIESPEYTALAKERIQTLLNQGHHLLDTVHRRKDGTQVPVEMSLRLFELSGAHLVLSVCRDITERKRAEEALRRSEENFRALFDNAKDAILIHDLQGRILEVNREACERLGYRRDELLTMSSREIEAPAYTAAHSQHMDRLLRQGHHLFESGYRRQDGSILPVEISVRLFDLGGQRLILNVCRDISERKQAEQALRESEQFVRSTLDSLAAHVCVLDQTGTILTVNKAWRGLTSDSAAQGQGFAEGGNYLAACDSAIDVSPETAAFAEGIRSVIRGEREEFSQEYPWHAGTRRRWLIGRATRFKGAGPLRIVVSHENITARKLTEQLLKESQERYRTLLVNLPIGVYRSAPGQEGRLLMANPALARMLGYETPDDLLQYHIFDACARPDDRRRLVSLLRTQGHFEDAEILLCRRDGTQFWCRLTAKAIRNMRGHAEYYDGTVEDLTERKRAERERTDMQIQLQQAQKLESIGRLAAGIAHEINTPIQYIGDNTRFLHDAFTGLTRLFTQYETLRRAVGAQAAEPTLLGEVAAAIEQTDADYVMSEVPKAIEQTLEGVERVARIVRAMKEFSHPGSAEKTAINLNRAIESTVTVARNEWKYVADLVLELESSLPPVFCLPGEFNQVILNLLINAAHAIAEKVGDGSKGKGKITVSTRRDGDWVEVRIQDSGAGIPQAIQSRMFEPFFTTKPVGKGTGQGLAIARSVIVDKHGGTIAFESQEAVGTAFIIRLPINPTTTSTREQLAA